MLCITFRLGPASSETDGKPNSTEADILHLDVSFYNRSQLSVSAGPQSAISTLCDVSGFEGNGSLTPHTFGREAEKAVILG